MGRWRALRWPAPALRIDLDLSLVAIHDPHSEQRLVPKSLPGLQNSNDNDPFCLSNVL
jgi:hypothetical protein